MYLFTRPPGASAQCIRPAGVWGQSPHKIEMLFNNLLTDNSKPKPKMAQQQKRANQCEAEYYGKCGGQLRQREVMYHCRPRSKDVVRGHGPFDETAQVVLCDGHFKRICADYEGKLPELYGWDFADSLECLTAKLKYTGYPSSVFCVHCSFPIKDTETETGICTDTCILLQEIHKNNGPAWECKCAIPIECVCASYNNNHLHWALLTYVNGFEFNDYKCDACSRPSWRDSHKEYLDGLSDISVIIEMCRSNLELLLEKNAKGKTPLDLIPEMIASLEETLADEYLKCAEYGWANSNIMGLEKIRDSATHALRSADALGGR